jgi:hypothetical protein
MSRRLRTFASLVGFVACSFSVAHCKSSSASLSQPEDASATSVRELGGVKFETTGTGSDAYARIAEQPPGNAPLVRLDTRGCFKNQISSWGRIGLGNGFAHNADELVSMVATAARQAPTPATILRLELTPIEGRRGAPPCVIDIPAKDAAAMAEASAAPTNPNAPLAPTPQPSTPDGKDKGPKAPATPNAVVKGDGDAARLGGCACGLMPAKDGWKCTIVAFDDRSRAIETIDGAVTPNPALNTVYCSISSVLGARGAESTKKLCDPLEFRFHLLAGGYGCYR